MKYRTIVADPPWEYQPGRGLTAKNDRKAAVADFYPTMTFADIAAMPIAPLAEDNAHLYLWVTNTKLFDEHNGWNLRRIVEAWGFTYKTLLTWNKTGPLGLGRYFRGRTEHVMFCVRGSLPVPAERREQNIFSATNGAHSVKPDTFYDLVERVSPGPYLELFARRARLGDWHYWGNESLDTADVGEAA